MTILEESIGNQYKQTLKVYNDNRDSEVEVTQKGETKYKGTAKNIHDTGNTLSFIDKDGKQHRYVKYTISTSCYP